MGQIFTANDESFVKAGAIALILPQDYFCESTRWDSDFVMI